MKYRLLSWNVNGVRAAERKGFIDWLCRENPCYIGIQETKAKVDQLSDKLIHPPGYVSYWNSAERKGYSGVAAFTNKKVLSVSHSMGRKEFDNEGRMVITEMAQFIILNMYFPNGGSGEERLRYKMSFYSAFLDFIDQLKKKKKKPLIVCGDVNTAHKEIDLARPKENQFVSGFLQQERDWIDELIGWGMVDSFREFYEQGGHYTWWDMKTRARDRNVGWRLDYFFVDQEIRSAIKEAHIYKDVMGSDHCPIGIVLEF